MLINHADCVEFAGHSAHPAAFAKVIIDRNFVIFNSINCAVWAIIKTTHATFAFVHINYRALASPACVFSRKPPSLPAGTVSKIFRL